MIVYNEEKVMEKYLIVKESERESFIKYMDAQENEEATIYYVEILSDCDLRCNMCPFSCRDIFQREHGMMSEENFVEIIKKISTVSPHAKVHIYHHCEPMLHPKVSQYVKIVKQYGLKCGISTSLNRIERLKEVINSGLHEIIISVSGFYQETYEKSHVGGNIETVKRNMVLLKNMLREMNKKVDVLVSYHMYLDNIGSDYREMQKLINELGYTFLPIWSRSINLEMNMKYLREKGLSRWFDKDSWLQEGRLPEKFYLTMKRMAHKPEFFLEGEWENIEGEVCPCDNRMINIHWDGKIEACSCGFDDRLNIYGDYVSVDINKFYKQRRDSSICKECLKNNIAFYMHYTDLRNVERIAYEVLKNSEEEICPEVFGKDIDEIKIFCREHGIIYIYGAGKSGRKLKHLLDIEGVNNVSGYIVSSISSEEQKEVLDTVIGLKELKSIKCENIGIIVAMKRQYKAEICDKITKISNDVIFAAEYLLY